MYFSGRAEVTVGEIRALEKRGPFVEEGKLASPLRAAGEDHMMDAARRN